MEKKEGGKKGSKDCSLFQDFSFLVLNSGYQWHGNFALPWHDTCFHTSVLLYIHTSIPSTLLSMIKIFIITQKSVQAFYGYVPFLLRNSAAPHSHLSYVTGSSLSWHIFLQSYSRLLISHKADYVIQVNWGKNRINLPIKGFGDIWRWFSKPLMRK